MSTQLLRPGLIGPSVALTDCVRSLSSEMSVASWIGIDVYLTRLTARPGQAMPIILTVFGSSLRLPLAFLVVIVIVAFVIVFPVNGGARVHRSLVRKSRCQEGIQPNRCQEQVSLLRQSLQAQVWFALCFRSCCCPVMFLLVQI